MLVIPLQAKSAYSAKIVVQVHLRHVSACPLSNVSHIPRVARQSALSPAQWLKVRDMSVAGITDAQILAEYADSGLSRAALWKRREREQWPSPSALSHQARKAVAAANAAPPAVNVSIVRSAPDKSSRTLILEAVQEATMASFASLNARACSAMDAAAIPDVETMRDLNMLTQIAERTGRLNEGKGGMNLQVNVAVSPWQRSSRSSERVIDVEDSQ